MVKVPKHLAIPIDARISESVNYGCREEQLHSIVPSHVQVRHGIVWIEAKPIIKLRGFF